MSHSTKAVTMFGLCFAGCVLPWHCVCISVTPTHVNHPHSGVGSFPPHLSHALLFICLWWGRWRIHLLGEEEHEMSCVTSLRQSRPPGCSDDPACLCLLRSACLCIVQLRFYVEFFLKSLNEAEWHLFQSVKCNLGTLASVLMFRKRVQMIMGRHDCTEG